MCTVRSCNCEDSVCAASPFGSAFKSVPALPPPPPPTSPAPFSFPLCAWPTFSVFHFLDPRWKIIHDYIMCVCCVRRELVCEWILLYAHWHRCEIRPNCAKWCSTWESCPRAATHERAQASALVRFEFHGGVAVVNAICERWTKILINL